MKILVATDGSECSTYAVKVFCRLFPNRSHLKIKVVAVYEEQYALAAETFSVPAEYYQQLADAAKSQPGHFTATAAEIIQGGDGEMDLKIKIMRGSPEKEIVEFAEELGSRSDRGRLARAGTHRTDARIGFRCGRSSRSLLSHDY